VFDSLLPLFIPKVSSLTSHSTPRLHAPSPRSILSKHHLILFLTLYWLLRNPTNSFLAALFDIDRFYVMRLGKMGVNAAWPTPEEWDQEINKCDGLLPESLRNKNIAVAIDEGQKYRCGTRRREQKKVQKKRSNLNL